MSIKPLQPTANKPRLIHIVKPRIELILPQPNRA
jgi:hypothetical protein